VAALELQWWPALGSEGSDLHGTTAPRRSLELQVRETVLLTEAMPADSRDRDAGRRFGARTGTRTSVPPALSLAQEALQHLDSLHHFARYLTGTAAEAEDLVQDTYARALGAAPNFAPGTNLRAWLFRILRNLFIDGVRRSGSAPALAEDEPSELSAPSHEPLRGDAEMEALRGRVAHDIERALASLSPEARTVILLDLEGFTETEVAEILGCALGTVKSRLGRARESLRHRLEQYRK
jgi:RNA polymerase sigma-70 factor, ECF subfamily